MISAVLHNRTLVYRMLVAAACLAVSAFPTSSSAQSQSPSVARRATIHWDQAPIADAMQRLSETFGDALLVDRRVDPSQRLTLDAVNVDFRQALQQTADALGLGVAEVNSLAYLGPRATTDQMRTLAAVRDDEASRIPATARARIMQKKPFVWPRLSEPRALVANAVAERGWQAAGLELIPHDLWPAGTLPDMTLAEHLTALLAGFDLTFRFDGAHRAVEVVPITGPVTLTKRYRLRYGEADLTRLRQQFPDLALRLDGDYASVDARVEEHQQVAAWLGGSASRTGSRESSGRSRNVYTLHVQEQTVRAVLNTLVERLNLRIGIDESAIQAAGLSLDKRVTFEVTNASQDELLQALLQPAGLAASKQGNAIKIVPAK